MLRLLKTAPARGLLGLLSLIAALGPLLAAGPVVRADEPKIALEAKWLLLRREDVTLTSQAIVQLPDQSSQDARGLLTVRRFDPDYKGRDDAGAVPTLILDKLWQANDVATAQQIFQEQADAGFAETSRPIGCVGDFGLPPLGDESRGIKGFSPCDSNTVHHRVVFRYLNAVHVLYVYGDIAYSYTDVVVNLANILNERIRTVPTGPAADVMWNGSPHTVALGVGDMGKQIDTDGEAEGSDDRAQWYWARFTRGKQFEVSHIGPLDIYNKVWVARDIDTAHDIFAEQSIQGFPEARQEVGKGQFPMENLPGVGNDNFGWSACNDDCNTKDFRFLHHRYVARMGNVVIVIYTWGGNQDNSPGQVGFYAQSMRDRMK